MFVHLRLHTEFSVVDGTTPIDEVVPAAAACVVVMAAGGLEALDVVSSSSVDHLDGVCGRR